MAWSIEFSDPARKYLLKAAKQTSTPISKFLHRLSEMENPRSIVKALTGSELGHLWKYRVGDYRIVADIQDQTLRILIVRVGNRRDVYRK